MGWRCIISWVLKISGDLATGTIDSFEFLSNNISYNTSGNTLQVTTLLEFITNDAGGVLGPIHIME